MLIIVRYLVKRPKTLFFLCYVNDTLRMYKNDDIRMYNFDCITNTRIKMITICNTDIDII